MSDRAAEFERHRGHMMALAYRMLGSLSDAEDAVQDASVRWLQTNGADIRSAEGWLVAVTTRLCIDRLRHLESERAAYPGIWLPEPILDDEPDGCIEMRADISVALLVLLRQLSPNERAVFVLHDVLEVGFEEIAAILGKSGAACRQMAHRARDRIHEDHPRFPADGQAHKG
jgi:RNA polymerase sigma-70 factor (ECF subfamily)